MNDVINLNATIIRKRFKIYGFFNIASLSLVIITLLAATKYIQYLIGGYEEKSIFLLLFSIISFMPLIFPNKYEENCNRHKTFFTKLDISAIQSYFSVKNIVIYHCFITYLFLPYSISYLGAFSVLMFIHGVLILALITLKSKISKTIFSSIYSGVRIIVTVLIFIHLGTPFTIVASKIIPNYIISILFMATGLLFWRSLIQIKPDGFVFDSQIIFLTFTRKIPFLSSNSDVLMFIRKSGFFNALITIVMSNIAFMAININEEDILIKFVLSMAIAHFTIFSDFVADEKNKIIFFYNYHTSKEIIKRKTKSTILSSLILFPFVFVICVFFIPAKVILVGYLLSVVIFVVAVTIIPFNAKKNNLTPLYSTKQMIALFAILISLSLISILLI